MKTIKFILTVFAIACICIQTQAQNELPYRSLKLFKQDTLRYLDYNFTIRADQYTGKTVGDLIKDLDLPIAYIDHFVAEGRSNSSHSYLMMMNLGICMMKDAPNALSDYYVTISIKDGIDQADLPYPKRDEKGIILWTPELYEVFKNCKLSCWPRLTTYTTFT